MTEARSWIDFENAELSAREQCRLLGIQRSAIDDEPQSDTEENLQFMRRMDEEHLKHPARSSTQKVDFSEDQGFHGPWGHPAMTHEWPWGHPAMTRECVQPGCRGLMETVPSGLLDGHRYWVSTLRK